ncbi:hypothetical protein [Paucisalibacillus sp. EB02]|uniref:hypothetical protein n=1 Tax=Paucisalibacillus sp. EB02 TaxID=1347087 RepID=UPI0005A8E520|nr:hypothetical protein [Paucisalibacillus sp. EB02]
MVKKRKKRIEFFFLIILVATLIGSFVLIFLGHFMLGIIVGGVFMFLANFISRWFSGKNDEYVYRNIYETNKDRYNR